MLEGEGDAVVEQAPAIPHPPIVPVTNHRAAIITWANWGVTHHPHFNNQPQVNYAFTGYYPEHSKPGTLPISVSCSGFITLMAEWANCPDPNGLAFDGRAYTGYMLDHCTEIAALDAKPADLIVYGPGEGEHVVIIVGVGPDGVLVHEHGDFRVISHGKQGDPIVTSNSIEASIHAAPQRFLRWLPV